MDHKNERDFIKRFTRHALAKKTFSAVGSLLAKMEDNAKKDKKAFIVVISLLVIIIITFIGYKCFQKPSFLVSTEMVKITELITNNDCTRILRNKIIFNLKGKAKHAYISCDNKAKINDIVKVGFFNNNATNTQYYKVLETKCGINP